MSANSPAPNQGLGYVIQFASTQLDTPLIFAALVVVSVLGLAFYYWSNSPNGCSCRGRRNSIPVHSAGLVVEINRGSDVRMKAILARGSQSRSSLGTAALAADNVSVQLDYVVRGNHAMFFVAKEKGYFAKQGIDVTAIQRGTGSPNAMRLVGNGNAEFGFGDLPTLAVARSQNVPVVALAAVNQHSPLGMLALASKHKLTKPQDLKGLNIGVQPSGSTYVFLKAFLAANGMSLDDIKQSTVNPPYENYLLLGRVDAVPGYIDAEVPELEAKAGGPGSLSIMQGSDFGYTVYGSGLFTSEKMIAEKSDLVQRFVNAYMQAFADVVKNPQEAADIIVEANPEYAPKKDVLVKQIEADIKGTFFSADTKAHGLGWMTKDALGEDNQDPARPGRDETADRRRCRLQRQVSRERKRSETVNHINREKIQHDPPSWPRDVGQRAESHLFA